MARTALRGLLLVAAAVMTAAVPAADSSPRQAAQLVDRHYYESAAAGLRPVAADPANRFLLARAYLGNAELYRALARSSLATGSRYLQKLSAQKGRDRSRLATFYYGEYLLESGKGEAGAAQLRAFLGEAGVPARYRELAEVRLAAVKSRTAPVLPQVKSADAEVRSQAAAVLARSDKTRAQALALIDTAVGAGARPGETRSTRLVTNALEVYARAGEYDKAFALLASADLSRPSHEERIGDSKVLRFYDPALLGNLALLYQGAAERTLESLAGDARLKGLAGYFRAANYLDTERPAQAAALLPALTTAAELPADYRERAAVLAAEAELRTGKAQSGNAALAELGRRHAQDPALLAEVLEACVRGRGKCDAVVTEARQVAAANQGERYRGLHHAVGLQYLAARQTERALLALETARDKSNKNRIDTNDPLLLVTLADLYLETKAFSENLEIYFELSKEFPAVRQLQETGQGIYSMEYRSAGDVKIF